MPQISIEIPLTWGNRLEEQMEAIRNQTFQDYEILVSTSMPQGTHSDLLREYGATIIQCGPNILQKRYKAHIHSNGEFSLLLDETRIPHRHLLSKLQDIEKDMVVIEERDIGNTFWVRMSNLDKIISLECNGLEADKGFVLPRYFKSFLLTQSFKEIRRNLDDTVFRSVLMEDHQLIYFEASKLSSSIAKLNGPYLRHYGDESLFSIVNKYYRYGKGHKILRHTHYEKLLSPKMRVRKICSENRMSLYLFYLARGLPFLIGYYLG